MSSARLVESSCSGQWSTEKDADGGKKREGVVGSNELTVHDEAAACSDSCEMCVISGFVELYAALYAIIAVDFSQHFHNFCKQNLLDCRLRHRFKLYKI